MPSPALSSRVSVACVIPTHRRPRLLAEALRSAIAQTHAPAEVFVADDAGSDESKAIAEAIACASAVPIHYCAHQEGPGPSTSRNLGARAASAESAFVLVLAHWAATLTAQLTRSARR